MQDVANHKAHDVLLANPLDQLKNYIGQSKSEYPKEIIDSIIKQRDYTVPLMLEKLQHFLESIRPEMNNQEWTEGIVICFILAKLREKRLFPYLITLCQMPDNTAEKFWGDVKTEHLQSLLASSYNGDFSSLYAVAVNQYLNEYVRGATLDAMIILYVKNIISREAIVDAFKKLFIELKNDHSYIPSALVSDTCDIYAPELLPEIQSYFDRDIIDTMYISMENVEDTFLQSQDEILSEVRQETSKQLVEDLEGDLSWIFRHNGDNTNTKQDPYEAARNFFSSLEKSDGLYKKPQPKIGRNELCPCGSKKKYKKCCADISF